MKAFVLIYLLPLATLVIGSPSVPLPSRYLRDIEPNTIYQTLPSDLNIHLYTNMDQIAGPGDLIPMTDFDGDLDATSFKPSDPSYIFIHGWTLDYNILKRVLPLILPENKANIFIVDYSKISKLFYTLAVTKLPSAADILAKAFKAIQLKYHWDFGTVYLIGHSLGGQMCGLIGAKLDGKLRAIQALDPAGPLYEDKDPSFRLDSTDAQFVQVIHTNGGLWGTKNSWGHADYYPSGGGMNQPGCGSDLLGLCAHFRALFYYCESINSNEFVARSCQSYEEYRNGDCKDNPTTIMGKLKPDETASGRYYLNTNEVEPYGQGSIKQTRLV